MAGATIRSQLSFVGIVPGMTGITLLGSAFQVLDAALPCVTGTTLHLCVFTGELEGNFIMVKIVPISIQPIVASHAVLPKILQVGWHELRLYLLVAIGTYGLVKRSETLGVTRTACKY